MTRFQAIHLIRKLAGEGRMEVSDHAMQRLLERGFTLADVNYAVQNVRTTVQQKHNGRWLSSGPSLDGRVCRLVLAIEDNVIVVTTWDPNRKDEE